MLRMMHNASMWRRRYNRFNAPAAMSMPHMTAARRTKRTTSLPRNVPRWGNPGTARHGNQRQRYGGTSK
eukprot:1160068-Pelagomonas_calceolata.AAC.3